jgi:hypothetical protein
MLRLLFELIRLSLNFLRGKSGQYMSVGCWLIASTCEREDSATEKYRLNPQG